MNIIQSPSKNFGSRGTYKPELIVLHCTDGFYPSDLEWLRGSPGSKVSSHYYVAPNGNVHQLVPDEKTSWHAGTLENPTAKLLKKDSLGKIINPNYYTIGIETSLRAPNPPTSYEWNSLKELIRLLSTKWNIPIDKDHIIGHHEIRASKTCPSPIVPASLVDELGDKEEIKRKIKELVDKL